MSIPRIGKHREKFELTMGYDQASTSASLTWALHKIPTGRKFRIAGFDYVNPTGLATDATNYFTIQVLKNAVVSASFSTLTGAQGTIAANTFVAGVLSATDADLVLDAADILKVAFIKSGTQTLPAGRIVVRGTYV